MKKILMLPLLAIVVTLSSCTKDTAETEDFNVQEQNLTKSKKIEDDPNFIELVSNYATLMDKAYININDAMPIPPTVTAEEILNYLEFNDKNEFMEYQFHQYTYYSRLIEDYNIKSKTEIKDLSDKILLATNTSLERSYQSKWGVCEINLVYCLMGALAQYTEYLAENTGIGCDWSPGSDCMNDLEEYQDFTFWVMGMCVSDYAGC